MSIRPNLDFLNLSVCYVKKNALRGIKTKKKYASGKEKSLVEWAPGVNFINVLHAFTHADPKSIKRQSSCQSF